MIRRLLALASTMTLAALGLGLAASPSEAQEAGGGLCELRGAANLSPGLGSAAQDFTYDFGGDLTSCQSDDATAPATGSVTAGQQITDPGGSGLTLQEPPATGNGSCASSTTAGTAIIEWADGTVTVVSYETTGATAAVELQGQVIDSITLDVVDPQLGDPTTVTVNTTRYQGDEALGQLVFSTDDPSACAGDGVTVAHIDGVTGLGHAG